MVDINMNPLLSMRLNILRSCLSEEINNELEKERNFQGIWGENAIRAYGNMWSVDLDTVQFTALGLDFIHNCRINSNS